MPLGVSTPSATTSRPRLRPSCTVDFTIAASLLSSFMAITKDLSILIVLTGRFFRETSDE